MPIPEDFDRARRARHLGKSNDGVSPMDALKNAADFIGELSEPVHRALVLLEQDDGHLVIFSADIMLSEAVTILEKAKLTMLLDG